ncbi:permease-like cell division protein FtsX [Dactylosporangium sucinum]|uniref:FtsX extracellular domain-containing protein n=1 Tax=Dactylosporangium sucinum TaxID=1424081 RepID=A0A917U2R2_9ACTN|nr:permease-like cell division protein FtsX [Dactylosporangium sucinum]GGM54096.1 hypothetical protein GCM10007977_064640 [Dactylosporangium sucinum]
MPELDDRIRTALGALAEQAERQLHAPGAAAAATAGHRRRLAGAGAALALLAGATATGAWTLSDRPAEVAACTPAEVTAFLPIYGEEEAKAAVGSVLYASPEVTSVVFESRREAWERFRVEFADTPELVNATTEDQIPASWRFTLRCTTDFPPVKSRLLESTRIVDVICQRCEPSPTPTR